MKSNGIMSSSSSGITKHNYLFQLDDHLYTTQNQLLLNNLNTFYNKDDNLDIILPIINGSSLLSIRIIDWFVTNYSKMYYVVYNIKDVKGNDKRFKVYTDYKLKLKAYSKKRFDPFCRWDRIHIPYKDDTYIQTTLGQLNFFKWALENKIIEYIQQNQFEIEKDMNHRNSSAKKNKTLKSSEKQLDKLTNASIRGKTRKRREELSLSATKSIKKENVEIRVKFDV